MLHTITATAAALVLALAGLTADVWDDQLTPDDTVATGNELSHGGDQLHDLAGRGGGNPDIDFFRIALKPYRSYEVVVEGLSADFGAVGNLLLEQRSGASGATVVAAAVGESGVLLNRTLRLRNTTGTAITNTYIRVGGAACAAFCGVDDQYRIRMMETTLSFARFNNSGTQITVLFVQNSSEAAVDATLHFWTAAGAAVGGPFNATIPARGLHVFNSSAQAALIGQNGSVTITHTGPYGSLNGKAVALEPATGFSFDTAGTYRTF